MKEQIEESHSLIVLAIIFFKVWLQILKNKKGNQMTGVKELLELVAGLKELIILGKHVLKDGKVDFGDLTLVGELLTQQRLLLDAFTGLSALEAEVKDLGLDEIKQVIQALMDAVKEVEAA